MRGLRGAAVLHALEARAQALAVGAAEAEAATQVEKAKLFPGKLVFSSPPCHTPSSVHPNPRASSFPLPSLLAIQYYKCHQVRRAEQAAKLGAHA